MSVVVFMSNVKQNPFVCHLFGGRIPEKWMKYLEITWLEKTTFSLLLHALFFALLIAGKIMGLVFTPVSDENN